MNTDMNDLGRRLVDPELLPLLDLIPAVELTEETLPVLRKARFPLPETPGAAETVSLEARSLPGPYGAPDVQVLVYRPRQASGLLPCILHIHGGGFVGGSSEELTPIHLAMAMQLDCMIVAVDYRLAPEVRFPGAVEDCYAALAWVCAEARALGIDGHRSGVLG